MDTNGPLIASTTPTAIAEILKASGYRANVVEHERYPQVQSAAQGLGFFVGFGNPAASGGYSDFSFHCWITIQGELPPHLIDGWNQNKRFARLYRQGQLLILTMDVIVAGGVAPSHLRAQIELWDRVIHDFMRHLKQPAPAAAAGAAP
jgi:hypothetical protein